jgi:hypothetical protein
VKKEFENLVEDSWLEKSNIDPEIEVKEQIRKTKTAQG